MTSEDYDQIIRLKLNDICIKEIYTIEPKGACTCNIKLAIEKRIKEFR